jgi:hypothetical protein
LTAAAASASTAASAALRFWTGLVDSQIAPIEFVTAKRSDGSIAFGVVTHLDKPEAF